MTHAALKSLIARVRAGSEAAPWVVAELERIAALSAMEGEAVAWMVERNSDPSFPRIMRTKAEADSLIFYCNVNPPVTKRPLIYGDTDPPPQQAEKCGRCDGTSDPICRRCETEIYTATHPTPSPGPQGGGEAVAWLLTDERINHLQVASVQRLIDRVKGAHHTDLIIRINGNDEHYEADWLKHLVRATPPAHQPGEVVTDAMVERMAKWLCRQEIGESATLDVVLWRMTKWERYVGEARAGLTAALAPKEDGHDR